MFVDPVTSRQGPINYYNYGLEPDHDPKHSGEMVVVARPVPFQHDTMSVCVQPAAYLDMKSPNQNVQPRGMEGIQINNRNMLVYLQQIEDGKRRVDAIANGGFMPLYQKLNS